MSILSTDLKAYQAASMPEDDVSTSGGAIATTGKVEFTDIAAPDVVDYVSDGADTRSVTVTGRDATGAIVSETKTLNGVTTVNGTQTFERILKIAITSDPSRTFTLKRHTGSVTIATAEPLYTSVRRLFYNSASAGSSTVRYEKIFWKNTNATITLTSAQMTLTADPQARLQLGCAPSVGVTATVTNRLTAPASVTFVGVGVAQSVPGGSIAAGSAIGVWLQQTLPANDPAFKNTFTTQLSGQTT